MEGGNAYSPRPLSCQGNWGRYCRVVGGLGPPEALQPWSHMETQEGDCEGPLRAVQSRTNKWQPDIPLFVPSFIPSANIYVGPTMCQTPNSAMKERPCPHETHCVERKASR